MAVGADMQQSIEAVVRIGAVIADKYRVDRLLDVGGMGAVAVATHIELQQQVAIKFLLPKARENPDAVERFLREARAAVQLGGEHVVRVSDVGRQDDGSPYMVMELLTGESLAKLLARRSSLPVPEAVDLSMQTCLGLAEAHRLGIAHRDLKPANLFLSTRTDGSTIVKILDFGISKVLSGHDRQASLTQTSQLLGTPGYMSPEQVRDVKRVDVKTDIWALGAILYEMLMGTAPFRSDSLPGVLAAVLQSPPSPPLATHVGLPSPLVAVIEHCLEKDRERRFQTVAELAMALEPFANEYQGAGYRVASILGSAPARLSDPGVAPSAPPSAVRQQLQGGCGGEPPDACANQTSPTSRAWGRSTASTFSALGPTAGRWAILVALSATGLLLGFGAGLWWWQRSSSAAASSAVPPTGSRIPAARMTAPDSTQQDVPPVQRGVQPVISVRPAGSAGSAGGSPVPLPRRAERPRREQRNERAMPVEPPSATTPQRAPKPKAERGNTAPAPSSTGDSASEEKATAPASERAPPARPRAAEDTTPLPLPDPGLVGY